MKLPAQLLRYATAIAQTDAGAAAVLALGGPVAALLVKFGTLGLSAVLADWTAPEITDADVEQALATKGFVVRPFDVKTLWG